MTDDLDHLRSRRVALLAELAETRTRIRHIETERRKARSQAREVADAALRASLEKRRNERRLIELAQAEKKRARSNSPRSIWAKCRKAVKLRGFTLTKKRQSGSWVYCLQFLPDGTADLLSKHGYPPTIQGVDGFLHGP
jgi:hypothetical protein